MDGMSQTITVKNRLWRQFKSQHFHCGVPWPIGTLKDEKAISLSTDSGTRLPVAARVLNRWPDGSVQWSLLDFAVDFIEEEAHSLIAAADGKHSPLPVNPVKVRKSKSSVRASNGIVDIEFAKKGSVITEWHAGGRNVVEPNSFDVIVTDLNDKLYTVSMSDRKISVEHSNPLRAVIRVDGKHKAEDGSTLLHFWLKFTIVANRPDIKITYHFRNREEEIPSTKVKSIAITAKVGVGVDAKRSFIHTRRGRNSQWAMLRVDDDLEICAADCMDVDNYPTYHSENGTGMMFVRRREVLRDEGPDIPWFMRNREFRKSFRGPGGREMTTMPHIGLCGKEQSLLFCGGNMAGMHPKALRITDNTVNYFIWPDWAGPLEIRQGAGCTHDYYVTAMDAQTSDDEFLTQYLSWENGSVHNMRPSFDIIPDIEWVRACEVFNVHRLPQYLPDEHFHLERKISKVFHKHPTPIANGMWNYGDRYPDGGCIYNNEEMHMQTYLQDYLRSGKWDNGHRGLLGCQHIIDVDYVDYSIYPAQHHGMCAHCPQHNDGAVYPSHMWFHELFIAHALTGNPEFKQTALNMCENLLYWIDSDEEFGVVATDLRESGQPLIELTYAYQFNPDQRYVDGCMKIFTKALAANADHFGRMSAPEPNADIVAELADGYGDYAVNQGIFWLWELTGNEKIKEFYLKQCNLFVSEERAGTEGFYRTTDYNRAAFAYYMTGDRKWLDRIARAFRAAFREAKWPLGWQHSMYYMKLALDFGIVTDEDVLIQ